MRGFPRSERVKLTRRVSDHREALTKKSWMSDSFILRELGGSNERARSQVRALLFNVVAIGPPARAVRAEHQQNTIPPVRSLAEVLEYVTNLLHLSSLSSDWLKNNWALNILGLISFGELGFGNRHQRLSPW